MVRTRTAILALIAIAVFASAPAMAQDHSFKFFVTANWISPLAEEDVDFAGIEDAIQGSDEFGYEAGFEWRLNKILGIEGSYMLGSNNFELGSTDIGELDQQTITAALNIHIIPTTFFDLWVAPVASWYSFDDIDIDPSLGGGSVAIDSQWGYGAAVGFDIGLGKTFAITGGVRYIKLEVSGDSSSGIDDIGIDPLIARAGIAFRFGSR